MAILVANEFPIPDGVVLEGAQPMKTSGVGLANLWDHGNADYHDTATATTAITVPTGMVYTAMTNDGLGTYGIVNLPNGITKVWDASTGKFDFTEFTNGDIIHIRVDLEIITTANNQEVFVDMQLGQGGTAYTLPMIQSIVKNTGTYRALRATFFDLRDDNTRLNSAQIRVASDAAATVKVNGWNCLCNKKGYPIS